MIQSESDLKEGSDDQSKTVRRDFDEWKLVIWYIELDNCMSINRCYGVERF